MLQPTTHVRWKTKESSSNKMLVYEKQQGKKRQFSNANNLQGEKWISVKFPEKKRGLIPSVKAYLRKPRKKIKKHLLNEIKIC